MITGRWHQRAEPGGTNNPEQKHGSIYNVYFRSSRVSCICNDVVFLERRWRDVTEEERRVVRLALIVVPLAEILMFKVTIYLE